MSHHPQADAPGNVPLFRSPWLIDSRTDRVHMFPHEKTADCKYFGCQPCGFRTPPRCEDCGHHYHRGGHDWCPHIVECLDNNVGVRKSYTPRLPGKGGAARR